MAPYTKAAELHTNLLIRALEDEPTIPFVIEDPKVASEANATNTAKSNHDENGLAIARHENNFKIQIYDR